MVYMEGQSNIVGSNGAIRKLSDLTPHMITKHLTSLITRDVQPNCIHNWKNTSADWLIWEISAGGRLAAVTNRSRAVAA